MQRCQLFVIIFYLILQTKALLLLADLTFCKTCCMSAVRLEQLQKLTLSLSLPLLLAVEIAAFHC